MLLAVASPLLLPLQVCQMSTSLDVLLAMAGPLLLPLRVCQPGTGLDMVLAVMVPLLVPVRVCQPGTGFDVLLAVAVPLLVPSWSVNRARAYACYSRLRSRCCYRATVDMRLAVDNMFLEVAFIATATL
jgi:hypothetical protein